MKKPKPRKVNYQIVPTTDPAYEVLEEALDWHDELTEARVALAWRRSLKPDVDGHIVLGRCVKVSDLQKEFAEHDFIIVLNREYWDYFNPKQRLALMDHELCHAAVSLNKEGDEREDDRGRKVWRTRKHDIEEFRSVVERHGCYKADLERFAESLRKRTPLFEQEKPQGVAHA